MPHISITVTLVLLVVDIGVLIYFIHHIANQIQLPRVIASIAGDLAKAIETHAGNEAATKAAPSAAATLASLAAAGGTVAAPRSGYLQFIDRRTLVRIASGAEQSPPTSGWSSDRSRRSGRLARACPRS